MKNSDYCYIHSFGHFRKIPFWKNATFHFIATVLLTIGFFLCDKYTGPTLENQKKLLSTTNETQNDVKEIKEYLADYEKTNYDKLISRYPAGYMLFSISHSELILPARSNLLKDYELEWSKTTVVELTKETVAIFWPSIRYKPNRIFSAGNLSIIPRKYLQQPIINPSTPFMPHEFFMELLQDSSEGMIFLIGIKEKVK